MRLALVFALCQAACVTSPYARVLSGYKPIPRTEEVRGLWIVRDALLDPDNIPRLIDLMQENHLNTAMLQVRGRGDAYYGSSLEPRAHNLPEGYDPLAAFLSAATQAHIEVHAWVNALLIADESTRLLGDLSRHVVSTHPDWVLRDQAGRSMWELGEEELQASWAKGAFLDPGLTQVREYTTEVILDLLRTYRLAGVHLDFIRYPYSGWQQDKRQWGIDARHEESFAQATGPLRPGETPSAAQQEALNRFRAHNVTALVKQVAQAVRAEFPSVVLSAATIFSQDKIAKNVFQPWPAWLEAGLIDYAFLMAYQDDFHERMEAFYAPVFHERYVIGIGVHRELPPSHVHEQIRAARALGSAGICFFSHQAFLDAPGRIASYGLQELLPSAAPSGLHIKQPDT